MMINVGEENGVINEIEKEMIDGIFEYDDTLAKEIMTPRVNVFAVDINMPVEDLFVPLRIGGCEKHRCSFSRVARGLYARCSETYKIPFFTGSYIKYLFI